MRLGAFALCLLVLALAVTTVAGCVGRVPSQAQAGGTASGETVSAASGETVSAAAVAPEQAGSGQAGGPANGQAGSSSQGDSTFEELESTCDDLEAILEILETDSEQDSGL